MFFQKFLVQEMIESKKYRKKAETITALESKYENLSDEELKNEFNN